MKHPQYIHFGRMLLAINMLDFHSVKWSGTFMERGMLDIVVKPLIGHVLAPKLAVIFGAKPVYQSGSI